MPTLTGFLNPNLVSPSFLIPLLVTRAGSNYNLIQQINPAGKISAFLPFEVGVNCSFHGPKIDRQVDEEALWAFQLSTGAVLSGSAAEVRTHLNAMLPHGYFAQTPLLECEIAHFCHQEELYARSALTCFHMLALKNSRIAAEIWRDTVVFLPAVKSELSKRLPPSILSRDPTLSDLRVVVHNRKLTIEFPWLMFPPRPVATSLEDLPTTLQLARTFGIDQIAVTQGRYPWGSRGWLSHFRKAKVPGQAPLAREVAHARMLKHNPVSSKPAPLVFSKPVPLVSKKPVPLIGPVNLFRQQCIKRLLNLRWIIRQENANVPAVIAARDGRIAALAFLVSAEQLEDAIAILRQIYPGFSRYILADYVPTEGDQTRCSKDRITIFHHSRLAELPALS